MALTPASKPSLGRDSSGIALFMVIASVGMLSILVTEFTYIAQISQMIAFGGLDQAKAHYLAKSGLKLSLLRLKAYKQVKGLIAGAGGSGGIPGVPKSLIEKIWNFPFFYPIPTNIPGMSISDKDSLEKFQKESNFDGSFSALIESESSKYNLNALLSSYAATQPKTAPSGTPTSLTIPPPSSTAPTGFNAEDARGALLDYLQSLVNQKVLNEPEFADQYRDFRLEELVDSIAGWEDRTYERRLSTSHDPVPMKKAPFYSLTELHMLPNMDDDLYDLFAPNLTAGLTQGININTMQEATLRALVPSITKEEITDFFKFRDSEEADNQFTNADQFFSYLEKGIGTFKQNSQMLTTFKADLSKRNIILITEENVFKITVKANVNQASRTIVAWVLLTGGSSSSGGSGTSQTQTQQQGQQNVPLGTQTAAIATTTPDAGLKIIFMRIL